MPQKRPLAPWSTQRAPLPPVALQSSSTSQGLHSLGAAGTHTVTPSPTTAVKAK